MDNNKILGGVHSIKFINIFDYEDVFEGLCIEPKLIESIEVDFKIGSKIFRITADISNKKWMEVE